jgi:exodeoxyribonuclease VII small subunit
MSDLTPIQDLSYDEAVAELQHILGQMQGNQLGIDDLANQLQRASALLEFCQVKLTKTEAEVQAVLERLGLDDAT